MNIIVVILTIIKNWLKGIKSNIFTFFLCLIGLLISIYLYDVYNTVQEQKVLVIGHQLGNVEWENNYSLVYGMPSKDKWGRAMGEPGLKIERSIKHVSDTLIPITKDSIIKLAHNKLVNDRFGKLDSISMDCGWIINLYWNYQDNLWFTPHDLDPYRPSSDNLFETNHPNSSTQVIADEFYSNYIHYETMTLEPFPYHEGRWIGKNNWDGGTQCIELWKDSLEYINAHRFNPIHIGQIYDAHWYSAFDISKLVLDFSIQIHPRSSVNKFSIDFIDLVKADNVYPEPDERFYDHIVYCGFDDHFEYFKLYLEFPKNASIQQARNYILSAFITLFFTLLATIAYNIIKAKNNARRKRIKICATLCKEKHFRLATKIYYPILVNDIIIILGLMLPLIILNPFSWNSTKIVQYVLLVVVFILLFISTNYTATKINQGINAFYVSVSKLRIILKVLFVCQLFMLIIDSLTGWNILFFVLLFLYLAFMLYSYFMLKNKRIDYYCRPALKNKLWTKLLKICCDISLYIIAFFEVLKFLVECNVYKGWRVDWKVINSIEIFLLVILIVSYISKNVISYRRKI